MENNRISEQDLEQLLKHSFLEVDLSHNMNNQVVDSVAIHVLSPVPFLLHLKRYASRRFWQVLSSIGILTALGFLIWNITGKLATKMPVQKKPLSEKVNPAAIPPVKENNEDVVPVKDNVSQAPSKTMAATAEKPCDDLDLVHLQDQKPGNESIALIEPDRENKTKPDEYIFPVLTEKEKKQNEKEKKRLIRMASRITRDKRQDVVRIPASPDGKFGSFYMASIEATNNDYRTFLFDLLINGRKEEFLKARPQQSLWKNVDGKTEFDFLEKLYFSDKKYNVCPVVNISVEGAEMYCRWLEENVAAARLSDDKTPLLEIRLPYEDEWLYAASSGNKNAVYPWPLESVQNGRNFFMANFCIQKSKDQLKQPLHFPHNKEVPIGNQYTSAGMILNDPAVAAVDVWCYNPNVFGLYAVSGNVSEMVYAAEGSKKVKAKGGNWASEYSYLRLDSEDEFKEEIRPSPKIGFRICFFVKQ